MTATHFIAHDDNAIYGIGTTADGALADALAQESTLTGLKTQSCTQALHDLVEARGGAIGWATVDGVACTRDERDEA